jgi:hypothetical protein
VLCFWSLFLFRPSLLASLGGHYKVSPTISRFSLICSSNHYLWSIFVAASHAISFLLISWYNLMAHMVKFDTLWINKPNNTSLYGFLRGSPVIVQVCEFICLWLCTKRNFEYVYQSKFRGITNFLWFEHLALFLDCSVMYTEQNFAKLSSIAGLFSITRWCYFEDILQGKCIHL